MAELQFLRECVLQMLEDGARPPNFVRLQVRLSDQYSNAKSLANKWRALMKKPTTGEEGQGSVSAPSTLSKESPKKRARKEVTTPKKLKRSLEIDDGEDEMNSAPVKLE